ncbi:shikimate kinase [Clostridiales bacterium COT073_COT-073]|nr:shikimate kinase [Clostridiales bacterium COT073_COT-073]
MRKQNIILIGMSGAGKSTLGVILAKRMGYDFIDTDLLIQQKYGKLLQTIIDEEGNQEFARKEEALLSEIMFEQTIISTGGSAVYYEKAMEHLKTQGIIVYLAVPFAEILRRIGSPENRGILIPTGFTLEDVCRQREPLYLQYADIVLPVGKEETEMTVRRLQREIEQKSRALSDKYKQEGLEAGNTIITVSD